MLDQVVPEEPVVLVGHSMGGMAVMALAEQQPSLFGDRVAGVPLLSTSAGELDRVTLGLPGLPGRVLHRLAPALLAALARVPRLAESGRRAGSDLGYLLTRRYAFGGPVPGELVEFTEEMLAGTPIGVVADFFPGFSTHDRYAALAALRGVPVLVVTGTADLVTPARHSRRLADLLPSARLCELPGAGHMCMLERPDDVSRALCELLDRVDADAAP
ncbi:MAG: alpha/beta hydrolase [Actinomycetota bacterium]|nr:alpha/beta hydrolase [Actinomycetota bacterium]